MGGYQYAIEDGIEVITEGVKRTTYKIPCEVCGKIVTKYNYSRNRTYLCDYCKGVTKKKEKAIIPDVDTLHDRRFDKAVSNILDQAGIEADDYIKAIRLAATRKYKYGSVPEAMLAIALVKNRYSIIPQQKVGRYIVDFVLPKEKLVVEVDGDIFHADGKKELERDGYINLVLGMDWHIIHIPAGRITQDVKKVVIYIKSLQKRYAEDNNL